MLLSAAECCLRSVEIDKSGWRRSSSDWKTEVRTASCDLSRVCATAVATQAGEGRRGAETDPEGRGSSSLVVASVGGPTGRTSVVEGRPELWKHVTPGCFFPARMEAKVDKADPAEAGEEEETRVTAPEEKPAAPVPPTELAPSGSRSARDGRGSQRLRPGVELSNSEDPERTVIRRVAPKTSSASTAASHRGSGSPATRVRAAFWRTDALPRPTARLLQAAELRALTHALPSQRHRRGPPWAAAGPYRAPEGAAGAEPQARARRA